MGIERGWGMGNGEWGVGKGSILFHSPLLPIPPPPPYSVVASAVTSSSVRRCLPNIQTMPTLRK